MRYVGIICALLASAACASEGSRSAPTRVDSAGVSIVRYAALDTTLYWALSDAPALSIGVTDGDDPYLFSGISGIARLSDGPIAVGETRAREIRIFDHTGRFLRKMGGSGGGPGEFQYLYWFRVIPGDTILAWDGQLRRLTVFDRVGEVVRTSAPVVSTDADRWSAEDIFADRSLLLRLAKTEPPARVATMLEDTAMYVRWNPASPGDTHDTIQLPIRSVYVDSEGVYWPVGFMPRHALAIAGDRVYSIEGVDFMIRGHDKNGNLALIVRVEQESSRIPAHALQEYRDSVIAAAGNPVSEAYVRRILTQVPLPENYPALDRIRVDSEKRVWVREYARAGATHVRWHIFAASGEYQGAIGIPAALEVMAIEHDVILGYWTDELGVVTVRAYAIEEKRTPR